MTGGPIRARRLSVRAVAVVASVLVGAAGCTDTGLAGGTGTTSSETTAPATTAPAPAAPPATPPSSLPVPVEPAEPGAGPAALVDRLAVATEADADSYERELFGSDWIDADGDGCDTRQEVLVAESLTPAQVDPYGCAVVAGDWTSSYEGYSTPDPTELEIDHVVALAEAWRSGASQWDEATRLAFANDLDEPGALVAVTAATNRSKSDRDPAAWQPPDRGSWCGFATSWVTVKLRWALSADQAEVDALRNMLAAC